VENFAREKFCHRAKSLTGRKFSYEEEKKAKWRKWCTFFQAFLLFCLDVLRLACAASQLFDGQLEVDGQEEWREFFADDVLAFTVNLFVSLVNEDRGAIAGEKVR